MEAPASADRQAALQRRESDPAALKFLRDTKVGRMATLPRRGEEGVWDGLEVIELWPAEDEGQGICGDESGPGPPWTVYFLCLFLCFSFPLSIFFGGIRGEGDREAPLGRYGSSWVAVGDTGRGWECKKNVFNLPPVALGQWRSQGPSGRM